LKGFIMSLMPIQTAPPMRTSTALGARHGADQSCSHNERRAVEGGADQSWLTGWSSPPFEDDGIV
jgi:hypothetical protein